MPPDLDAEIRRSLCICFPKDAAVFSQSRQWHGSGPSFTSLIDQPGKVLAHTGVVDRIIRIGHQQFRAAGIQNVFVLPEYRGMHLSDAVLICAMAEAKRRSYDLGLLFCIEKLVPVYARCGWNRINNPTLRTENNQDIALPFDNIAMYLPLKVQSLSSTEPIHLQGNDW